MRIRLTAVARHLAVVAAITALAAGGIVTTGAAWAGGQPVTLRLDDVVLKPGEGQGSLGPMATQGDFDGTMVYAVSTRPLTDPAGAGLGLPAGMKVTVGADVFGTAGCSVAPGTTAIYLCTVSPNAVPGSPQISAAADVPDGTTAYYGAVFVPKGGSIDEALTEVRTIGTAPVSAPRAYPSYRNAARVVVESPEHVARNTVRLSIADLSASNAVTQQVRVHAVDPGQVELLFKSSAGQPAWSPDQQIGVRVTNATTTTPGATCDDEPADLTSPTPLVWCDLPAGDSTISYTLVAQPQVVSWKVDVNAQYRVYTSGQGNPGATATFSINGTGPAPSTASTGSSTVAAPSAEAAPPSATTPSAEATASGANTSSARPAATVNRGTSQALLLTVAGGVLLGGTATALLAVRRRRTRGSS
ncbi:hypothetical protein [Kitasatospora sp. LaBMicrA B282]|uniref:hypothetical protein n=1 Tax=Kitasatospora sp. LaBMicrA B282 TaxID=3420949 RepID=UPI003D124045